MQLAAPVCAIFFQHRHLKYCCQRPYNPPIGQEAAQNIEPLGLAPKILRNKGLAACSRGFLVYWAMLAPLAPLGCGDDGT